MVNQLMSVECAAGISAYFDIPLTMYESCRLSTMAAYVGKSRPVSIFDIISIPDRLITSGVRDYSFGRKVSLSGRYIGNHDILFAEGRKLLDVESIREATITETLANYSILFQDRSPLVNAAIGSVRFLSEYEELAGFIAKQIGPFNGIHARGTDFAQSIYQIQEQEFADAARSLSGKQLVLSSDESSKFAQMCKDVEFLPAERVILGEFQHEFESLTIANEVTLGLISMLLMTRSEQFMGTPKSTFSNYIHRRINQRLGGAHNWLNMGSEPLRKGSHYSWSMYPEIGMDDKAWQMEWPESIMPV